MRDATAALLARFESPKKTGDQWLVRCPAHEDKRASLAIKEGDDGRILLHCHASCSTENILHGLGLEPKDLFPAATGLSPTIVATYEYRGGDGVVRYQVVRFTPKDFRVRRPDGAGGWLWNLDGIERIVYRLDGLQGRESCLIVEGEKDVDAAWALKVPATCNPTGAGKWTDAYTRQLLEAGLSRVAVIPDNDPAGHAHAQTVAQSLARVGIVVRVVTLPDVSAKGDLSDYLSAGHAREELLALIRQTTPWTATSATVSSAHDFKPLSESRYVLTIQPENIVFDLDRVYQSHRELHGELSVMVNGACPTAKTIDGILSTADLNLVASRSRVERAKLLAQRSGNPGLDWEGFVEELCVKVIKAERQGQPAVILADQASDEDDSDRATWEIDGFPVLQRLPMVLFGDSSTGKSYFALYVAATLAFRGVNVLYVDWEFSQQEHTRRLHRLFQPPPKNLLYLRCDRPLLESVDRLRHVMTRHAVEYLVCDSVGFAIEGPAEYQDAAAGYFRAVRQLGVGTLNLAHIPKQRDDGKEAEIYGNAFFKHGARSVWFIERATDNPKGEIQFGLYHRKNNVGALLQPLGYRLIFERATTRLTTVNVDAVDELAAKKPLLDRMKTAVAGRDLTAKALADELGVPPNLVRAMVSRHRSTFLVTGKQISLAAGSLEF